MFRQMETDMQLNLKISETMKPCLSEGSKFSMALDHKHFKEPHSGSSNLVGMASNLLGIASNLTLLSLLPLFFQSFDF